MIEHAIPSRKIGRVVVAWSPLARASGCHILVVLILVLALGCNKKTTPTAVVPQGSAGVGGDAGKGDGASGRNTVLQMPFDNVAKVKLISIGYAYRLAMASGKPPKDAEELGAGSLKTNRDMQDHVVEVLYGVDPSRLQGEAADYMIAWEKEPTNDGYRMVLMADFATVKYVSQAEFEKMKKAK